MKVLKVSGNKISDLSEVKHLNSLEHLESLDMVGNPVMGKSKEAAEGAEGATENSGSEEVKAKIREMLPKLEVLNGFNKEG